MAKIRVTIWNENVHERAEGAFGDLIRGFYPHGIHNTLKEELAADDLEITAVSLDMPEQGLPDDLLNNTDVLMWWGHCAHGQVADALVKNGAKPTKKGKGLPSLKQWAKEKPGGKPRTSDDMLKWIETH